MHTPHSRQVPAPDVRMQAQPSGARAANGPRILLVEDDAVVRRLVSLVLRDSGFDVLAAADGAEAIALADGAPGPIDLLLTDVIMPRLGGADLAAHLRDARPTIPVVYMSGHAEEALAADGRLPTGVTMLHKPFGPADLVTVVSDLLRSH